MIRVGKAVHSSYLRSVNAFSLSVEKKVGTFAYICFSIYRVCAKVMLMMCEFIYVVAVAYFIDKTVVKEHP